MGYSIPKSTFSTMTGLLEEMKVGESMFGLSKLEGFLGSYIGYQGQDI